MVGDRDGRSLVDRLRAVPGPAWSLLAITGFAAAGRTWWLVLTAAGVAAASFSGQWGMRRRAARLSAVEAARSGGGVWLGRVPESQAESLWGRQLPPALSFMYFSDGYPVRVTANLSGLVLAPRGGLISRVSGLTPAVVPWSELAGARVRYQGFSTGTRSLWLLPMSTVTLDLVGASAEGHLPPPSPEEVSKLLRKLGIDPDDPDNLAELSEEEAAEEEAEEEAFQRELHGEDWRPGTRPLQLTTSRPDGLCDVVALRCQGRPETRRGDSDR